MGIELDQAFIPAEERRPRQETSDADEIPIIDLTPLLRNPIPDDDDHLLPPSSPLSDLIAEIGAACRSWGAFQIVNHGVSEELYDRVQSSAMEFFTLPKEDKRQVKRDEKNPFGYHDSEHTKNVRDWKEIFEYTPNEPLKYPAGVFWNQWPANPPDFRIACEEYAKAMGKLSYKLLQLLSLSLGLPANRLKPFFSEQTSTICLNYYPPCPSNDLTLGVGPHTDPGILTILAQDDVGGLDVKRKIDGEWVRVKPIPNAYVVNLADIAQVWSNDLYFSAEHRVVANSNRARFSVPFFLYPAHSTMVRPLEELTGETKPARYEDYNWGMFLNERIKGNFRKLEKKHLEISDLKKKL